MELSNTAAVLHGKLDLRLERKFVSTPGRGEVVVEMQACGICGTDITMWTQGGAGDFTISDPIVIGHESSGIILKVGDGISNLKIGDRVALELGIPCRLCKLCKQGKYNLCKGYSLGGLANYHLYMADFCHRLPDNLSMEEGALIEPLAVGVRACRRAGVTLGSSVLVCGAGPIGLASMLAAIAMGAGKICVTDLPQSRINLAKTKGATCTVLVQNEYSSKQVADKVVSSLGCRPQFAIETSGAQSSLQSAIYATRSGGVLTPVALEPEQVILPILNADLREVDIKGVFSYCSTDYKAAIAMLASEMVDAKPMISQRFNLQQVHEAFELAKNHPDGVMKVMVNCRSK